MIPRVINRINRSNRSGEENPPMKSVTKKVKMHATEQTVGKTSLTQSFEMEEYDQVAVTLPKAQRNQLDALGLISPVKIDQL